MTILNNKQMEITDLIGKTITDVKRKRAKGYSDTGFLELTFSDNTTALISAGYTGWDGHALDEYPTTIHVTKNSLLELVDI